LGKQELIQEYPPENWECPVCGHQHKKAHYSLPGQIDYTVEPDKAGRILFNRRNKNDALADDTPIDKSKPSKGKQFDKDGFQRPLFCPHCGYEDSWEVIIRTADLPNLIDRFFMENDIDPKKTWKKILGQFIDWMKRRTQGQ
jgi:hypothetical protein